MEELYDKIEQYLNGELTGAEAKAFEQSMRTDPELAAEVALHRKLQTVLADPDEWALRQTLKRIGEEQTTSFSGPRDNPAAQPTPTRPYLVVIALLMVAVAAYFIYVRQSAPAPIVPEENKVESPPANESPLQPLDPYAPQPTLDSLIATAPSVVYDFDVTVKKEARRLVLVGTLYALDLPADSTFLLQVYNNDPGRFPNEPVTAGRLRPEELSDSDGKFAFGAKKAFALLYEVDFVEDGRHYYTIRTTENSDEILLAGVVE